MTDTTVSPPAPDAAAEPDPAPSAAPERPLRTWGRRLLILVVLAGAVGVLLWGGSRAEVAEPTGTGNLVVLAQFPLDKGSALRQTEVGADLREGFDGRLTINGIAIPEEQMEGVLDPKSPEAVGYTGKQLRPNNRNHVFFAPGPGKVIEKLPQGKITATVTYFKDQQPSQGRGSKTWTFDVT